MEDVIVTLCVGPNPPGVGLKAGVPTIPLIVNAAEVTFESLYPALAAMALMLPVDETVKGPV